MGLVSCRTSAAFSLLRGSQATTGQDWLVFSTVRIVGPSMEPTIRNGEVYLVRRGGVVRVGDAVLLEHPQRPHLLTVKRAVRREGQGWWVEGDNPDASSDSRTFGVVPEEYIRGVLLVRVKPILRR